MEAVARRRTDTIHGAAGRDVTLPVVVWSAGPGPVVVVTANVHGDEVVGVAAAHALDEALASCLIRGTVALYPSLNPRGLAALVRVHPEDGVDLNRSFPGDRLAGGAARTAAVVWADVLSRKPDVVLDLHSDTSVSVPYAIVDRAPTLRPGVREVLEARLVALATSTGLLVLRDYPTEEYVRFRLDRSLAGAMVNHGGIPAVTLEIGARRTVDPGAVRTAADAVLRVLHHLGLVTTGPPPAPRVSLGPWRRAPAPRVQAAGLFVPLVPPGTEVAAGQVLGTVRGIDGTVREVVRADSRCLVVSWAETPWLEPRGVPGTLALPELP